MVEKSWVLRSKSNCYSDLIFCSSRFIEQYFLGPQKDWFLKQIKIDIDFLKKIGVLNYSLLVGIQSLHMDEVKQNNDMASVTLRAQKYV